MAYAGNNMPPLRMALYTLLLLLSITLLGLTITRVHYTMNLPRGDPLNGGRNFYERTIVELLVSSILTIFWSIYALHSIQRGLQVSSFPGTFNHEILTLVFLWLLWLVGVAYATHYWGDLSWCWHYKACRILTALIAIAWSGWGVMTILLFISAWIAHSRRAWGRPMHGRWDPALDGYANRRGFFGRARA
ncbi:hypothetical protein GGG16DRAFT_122591 [Schizophyllum commune]